MNNAQGPDLLGVCEVENRFVVDRLVDAVNAALPVPRSYAVVHADTDDARGIDVALRLRRHVLEVPGRSEESVFFHVVMRRNATREIVQVNFRTTAAGRTWAVFGNHWPSRSGGQYESAGYRAIAGETLELLPRAGARGARTEPRPCSPWATSTTSRSTTPWSGTP